MQPFTQMRKRTAPILALLSLLLTTGGRLEAQVTEEQRRFKLAQGYEDAGDLKNAARVYKELYDLDPMSNAYFEGVRRTYAMMQQFADLAPIVEARITAHPADVELRAFYGGLLHRLGKRGEAETQWMTAVEKRPDDPMTYMYIAQVQTELRLFDRAVETYRSGRRRLGGRETFADQLAQIYGIIGRYREAAEEYIGLLNDNPGRLNFVMGGLGMFTANPEGAKAAIEVTEKHADRARDPIPFLELLSWLYTEMNDYEGAFQVARRLDERRNAEGSNIYAFADRAYRTEKYEVAIKAFEYFLATYPATSPLYPSVIFSYTRALEESYRRAGVRSEGDAKKLISRYEEFIEGQPESPAVAEAYLQIARLQADELDNPEEALATIGTLKELGARHAVVPEATLFEGDLYLRTGRIDQAEKIYHDLMDIPGDTPQAVSLREQSSLKYAQTLFYSGRFKEAKSMFDNLSANTGSEAANDALEYQMVLQENLEKRDDDLRHYATGSLYLLQRKWKDAVEELDKVIASAPTPLADDALLNKATAQENLEQYAEASATLQTIAADYREGTVADRALFHAAEIAERNLEDKAKALELYAKILTEYPSSTYVTRAQQRIRALREES